MTATGGLRAHVSRRAWPIADASVLHLTYLFAIDAIALMWLSVAVVRARPDGHAIAVVLFLSVLAVVFEEVARRRARLQLRLSAELKRDMVSVWAVCGAVALPSAEAGALLAVVLIHVWFRQQRPAGEPLHRKWFNGSTEVLGCLAGGTALRWAADHLTGLPWTLGGLFSVIIGIATYAVINRLLVTVALVSVGVRGRELLGSRDDNLIEVATLCLGGLVALAVIYQPWLCILVLAPMVSLQRGSVVRELETAATTDAKTGLLNAVTWEQLAKREMARAVREDYGVGLLIIDVDRFKVVNDRFGHLAGDAVLRGVGKCLEASMREYDGVGRFGGEEFVAVLPNADEADAMVIAERTRAKVNQLKVSDFVEGIPDEADLNLAVSIGVSCMPTDGNELAELLHAADGALYRAKAMGRNRVVLADRGAGDPFVHVSTN